VHPSSPETAEALIRSGTTAFRNTMLAMFCAGFAVFDLLDYVQPLLPMFSADFGVGAAQSSLALSVTTGLMAPAMSDQACSAGSAAFSGKREGGTGSPPWSARRLARPFSFRFASGMSSRWSHDESSCSFAPSPFDSGEAAAHSLMHGLRASGILQHP